MAVLFSSLFIKRILLRHYDTLTIIVSHYDTLVVLSARMTDYFTIQRPIISIMFHSLVPFHLLLEILS